MSRYIEVHKAIESIRKYKHSRKSNIFQQGINFAIRAVCRELTDSRVIPTADVVEVKHGEWKHVKWESTDETEQSHQVVECSICGSIDDRVTRYCSNCGARMNRGACGELY